MSIELETIRGWHYVASMTRAGTIRARKADGSLELLAETDARRQVAFLALSKSVVISDDDCDMQFDSLFDHRVDLEYSPGSRFAQSGQAVDEALARYVGTGMSGNGGNVSIGGALSVAGTLNANDGINLPAAAVAFFRLFTTGQ